MPPNDGENRKIPGDRLVSRILTRVRRRPRMGLSPDFYARFGMADPWVAPEFGGEEPAPAGEGYVFLSAQPYYAMMRRLAAARRRRERRETAFQARHPSGTGIRAVARHWPGENAASLAVSRLARLALDEMTLPPKAAAPATPDVVTEQAPAHAGPARRAGSTFTQRGAKAWWSTPSAPAKVFTGVASLPQGHFAEVSAPSQASAPASVLKAAAPARRASAADHAGARLASASAHGGAAARAIAEALPTALGARHRALSRVVEAIEALPPEEQQVQIRRVVRRLGASAPAIRTVFEESTAAGAAAPRPAQVAARRADPASSASLRPVLSRSPAMALASVPEVDRAASGTLATAERSADSSGSAASLSRLPRRAASTQRALARGASAPVAGASSVPAPLAYARAVTTTALSASPVQRVTSAASAAAPAAPRSGGVARLTSPVPATPRASVLAAPTRIAGDTEAPRAAVRLPASARAVARYVAGSLGEAIPTQEAAQSAVRTTRGTWAAARDVSPADRDTAVRAVVRSAPAAAHAATRVEAGQVEGRSVLPRAIPSLDRVLAGPTPLPVAPTVVAALSASPVARTPRAVTEAGSVAPTGSTPVRTDAGAWVAARSPEGRATLTSRISAGNRAFSRAFPPAAALGVAAPRPAAGERTAVAVVRSGAIPAARTLASTAFRTAEPGVSATGAPATGAPPASTAAPSARTAAPSLGAAAPSLGAAAPSLRAAGVVHAAARATAPGAAITRIAPAYERTTLLSGTSSDASAPTGGARSAPRGSDLRGAAPRAAVAAPPTAQAPVAFLRALVARAPAMAHASARTDLPGERATLQPQVSPVAPRGASPVRAPRVAPSLRSPRAVGTPMVAAAARIDRVPGRSGAGARAVTDATNSLLAPSGAAPSRFARSGPLSFALPPVAASAPVDHTPAATARGAARARVHATRLYTTPESAYSPSSAVTTPSGIWMSARTAASTPGLRLLRTEAGHLVALAPAPT
ncbi:MAG: hypothetical protein Q8P41_04695, partial [Pseudomonadota bacterium]|nr:hypothetical protein [Pseudomonadota bacterium]